jgi:heme/copper-type cytochrome/quinol oxidase subunit 2
VTVRVALFWIATACCVFAELVILRSLLFGRARHAEAEHASGTSRVPRTSRPAEIAWALLPALGLLFVLYLTWRAIEPQPSPPSDVGHAGATIGA